MGIFSIDRIVEEASAVYENSKAPIILLDENLKIIYYNYSANNIYRMICIGDSLSRYLSLENIKLIKEKIKEQVFYSFEFENNPLFERFLFTRTDKDDKYFVRLQIDEKYSVRNVFEDLSLDSQLSAVISEQMLAPLSQMQVAVDFFSKKLFEEDLIRYVDYFRESIYELSRSTYRIAEIFRAFSSYGKFEVEYFDPVDIVNEITNRLEIDCNIDNDITRTIAFASKDSFATVVTSSYLFITSYKMIATKEHKIETHISENNGFICIKISRGGLDARDKREEHAFDFNFESDENLEDTLVIAREIINSAGGQISIDSTNGNKYKKVCVEIKIPSMDYCCYELSSSDRSSTCLNPYLSSIFEVLQKKIHNEK